jgi:hypothetical protein
MNKREISPATAIIIVIVVLIVVGAIYYLGFRPKGTSDAPFAGKGFQMGKMGMKGGGGAPMQGGAPAGQGSAGTATQGSGTPSGQ